MIKSIRPMASLSLAVLLTASSARCDFSYKLSTRLTGVMASMMAQLVPSEAQFAIRGNQMVVASQASVSIWDLDKATFTEIDLQKRTYSVTPISEISRGIRRAMELQMRQAGVDPDQLTTKIEICTSETGNVRKTNGVEFREVHVVVTMDMRIEKISSSISIVADGHVWLGPEQNGYDEQLKFNRKKWEQLGWDKDPESRGFDILYLLGVTEKEIDGLRGTPVSQTIQLRAGLLGPASGKGPMGGNVLVELTSDYSAFSSSQVDPSKFAIPSGFQKVQSELLRELPD